VGANVTSFNGWADAWGNSWGSGNPNEMHGSASFSINAYLTVNTGEMIGSASMTFTATLTLPLPTSGVSSKEKKKTKQSKHIGGNSPIGHEVYSNRVLSSELAEQIRPKINDKPSLSGVIDRINAVDLINAESQDLLKNSLLITNDLTIANQIKIESGYEDDDEIAQIIALLL
jgi:hypothetical protein